VRSVVEVPQLRQSSAVPLELALPIEPERDIPRRRNFALLELALQIEPDRDSIQLPGVDFIGLQTGIEGEHYPFPR
jgi:hypothetical protein